MSDDVSARLAAETAIRRLLSAYCDAVARRDAEAVGALFTPDCYAKIAYLPERFRVRRFFFGHLPLHFAAQLFKRLAMGLLLPRARDGALLLLGHEGGLVLGEKRIGRLIESHPGLSERAKHRMLGENAARFFGLTAAQTAA